MGKPRRQRILEGLPERTNQPATFEDDYGHVGTGFWCQADCLFIEAQSAGSAIRQYRDAVTRAEAAVSHNLFAAAIMRDRAVRDRDAWEAQALAANRLVHVLDLLEMTGDLPKPVLDALHHYRESVSLIGGARGEGQACAG